MTEYELKHKLWYIAQMLSDISESHRIYKWDNSHLLGIKKQRIDYDTLRLVVDRINDLIPG